MKHLLRMTIPILLLMSLAVVLTACEEDDKRWMPRDAAADADASVGDGGGFLVSCDGDEQCGSGRCVLFGDEKRCSQACDKTAPCPEAGGWSCDDKICRCTPKTPEDDVCDVDFDCDGVADRASMGEVCNGKDDDCNGTIDDVVAGIDGAKVYYRDSDGDGFGNVNESAWLCDPKEGWVDNPKDCDDERELDNPKSEEICGDAHDNDCDGRLEDPDVCGLAPIDCPTGYKVTDQQCKSAILATCGPTPGLGEAIDVTEVLFKQDIDRIKFTIRLVGSPVTDSCSTYKIGFADMGAADDAVVYIFRMDKTQCESDGLPQVAAYHNGQPITSSVETGFLAAAAGQSGHVSFIVDKSELFPLLGTQTYRVRACTNLKADEKLDLTDCASDTCEAMVHQ